MRPREHYIQQLDALHTDLRALGQMVISLITEAVDALARQDIELARQVVAADRHIDAAQYALEERTIAVMATQQPTAGDLRRLVAAIEIASELERIGDYAKGIAKITIRATTQPLVKSLNDLSQMAEQAIDMLNRGLEAFVKLDAHAARQLGEADDRVDELGKHIRIELIETMRNEPDMVAWAADLLFVAHNLERIADRTTNIAERVVFMVTGTIVELNP